MIDPVTEVERRFYSVQQAAQALGIARSTLYVLFDTGQLASVKIGRRRLVPATALDEFAQRLTDKAG